MNVVRFSGLSERRYPEKLPSIEYGLDLEVRRVQSDGLTRFKGFKVRIGKAFTGQPIGLRTLATDGFYEVIYCHQRIGWVDLRNVGADPSKTLTMLHKLD